MMPGKKLLYSLFVSVLCACGGTQPRRLTSDERGSFEYILAISVLSLRENSEGTLKEAEAGFELLRELDERDPRIWDGFASIAIRRGRYEEARSYLSQALEVDSGYSRAYAHRGFLEEQFKNAEAAMLWYREALRIDPLDAFSRNALLRLKSGQPLELEEEKLNILRALNQRVRP